RDEVEPLAPRRARSRRRKRVDGSSTVAEKLRMLERRVEEALASTGTQGPNGDRDLARAVFDEALDTLARVRRASWSDALTALSLFDRDVAPLLRLLYRYWWRVEAVGMDRIPRRG